MSGAPDRQRRVVVAHPSPDVYGSDRQLVASMAALRADGWHVTMVVPSAGPLLDLVTDEAEVRVQPFPVLRKALLAPKSLLGLLLGTPRELARLAATLRALRPDVVYVNTVTIPWWVLAARLTRTPVVVHVHEAESDAPRILRWALAAPLLLAARVMANSAAAARVLVETLPRLRRRLEVVPNGVPDPGAAPLSAARPDRLALVGRLSPRKGIDVALEAVALLRDRGLPVELEVCGSIYPGYEWYEQQLRERASRADLAGAVHLRGYVDPTAPVLATARAVLVPSRTEPFGNTAVEAMFARRPVIASRVQGLAEILTDRETGLLVPPDDAPALADAVEQVLRDDLLAARLADAGRDEALRRFSVDRYHREVCAVVAAAARRASRRSGNAAEDRPDSARGPRTSTL